MPRASVDDFLQNFRFHVTTELASPDSDTDVLKYDAAVGGVAGFQSVSMPGYSVNPAEYRDGISIFTVKQPGIPTAEDITMMRGVVRRDTVFLDWMFRYFQGNAFRVDLYIHQWDQTGNPVAREGRWPAERGAIDTDRERVTKLHNAFPTNVKPGGDLDATSDEISVAELTIAFEWFEPVLPIEIVPEQRSVEA